MYMRYLKRPSYANETFYKRYRNKLTHSLRIAKRIYYDRQLDHLKSNIKITWQILNEVINRKDEQANYHQPLFLVIKIYPVPLKLPIIFVITSLGRKYLTLMSRTVHI